MLYNIYVVNDKMAEEAGPPFVAVNDNVALRHYRNLGIPELVKNDYELLCIGTYDSKGMFVTPELSYMLVNKEVSVDE